MLTVGINGTIIPNDGTSSVTMSSGCRCRRRHYGFGILQQHCLGAPSVSINGSNELDILSVLDKKLPPVNVVRTNTTDIVPSVLTPYFLGKTLTRSVMKSAIFFLAGQRLFPSIEVWMDHNDFTITMVGGLIPLFMVVNTLDVKSGVLFGVGYLSSGLMAWAVIVVTAPLGGIIVLKYINTVRTSGYPALNGNLFGACTLLLVSFLSTLFFRHILHSFRITVGRR